MLILLRVRLSSEKIRQSATFPIPNLRECIANLWTNPAVVPTFIHVRLEWKRKYLPTSWCIGNYKDLLNSKRYRILNFYLKRLKRENKNFKIYSELCTSCEATLLGQSKVIWPVGPFNLLLDLPKWMSVSGKWTKSCFFSVLSTEPRWKRSDQIKIYIKKLYCMFCMHWPKITLMVLAFAVP